MKKAKKIVGLTLIGFTSCAVSGVDAAFLRRDPPPVPLAVVVGNGDYLQDFGQLPGIEKELELAVEDLSSRGMEVRRYHNLTESGFREMLEQVKESNPDRPLLLMLSGHGACIGDEAVFIPVDAQRSDLASAPLRWPSLSQVLDTLTHAGTTPVAVVFDSSLVSPSGASCNPLIKLSTLNSAVLFASTPGTAAQVDMAAGLGVLSKQWHQSLDAEPGSTDFLNVAARTISERRPDEYRQTFWLFSSLLQPIPIPAKGGQSSSSTR